MGLPGEESRKERDLFLFKGWYLADAIQRRQRFKKKSDYCVMYVLIETKMKQLRNFFSGMTAHTDMMRSKIV